MSKSLNKNPRKLHICSFESRRANEMRSLIERQGGTATVAPSMQEVPLDQNTEAIAFAEKLRDGGVDIVLFMTGVGARALLDAVSTQFDRDEFLHSLDACRIGVRGPKPAAVLREWGVHIDCRAPEPNTWKEFLTVLEADIPLVDTTVAIQEYGEPSNEFYGQLIQRGARVLPVPVYRWALPDDTGPLLSAIRATISGEFDVLMFTSANQLTNIRTVAESTDRWEAWQAAAQSCVIASIGPTASKALQAAGIPPQIEASPPKMGQLVRAVFKFFAERL